MLPVSGTLFARKRLSTSPTGSMAARPHASRRSLPLEGRVPSEARREGAERSEAGGVGVEARGAFPIVEFQRCRVPAFARFPCGRGECVALVRSDPTRPAASGGCPPSPRGPSRGRDSRASSSPRSLSRLASGWKKWEADTIDRASLNIENTARSSASTGAFTVGGVGWIGHSRCQPDRRRGPELGDRLAKPRYRCAAGPDAVSLP